MNKATFSALAVMIAAGLAVTVDAQARERSVNERQSNQRERVVAGARSGALTRPETRQLNREARGIERKEQVFRVVTRICHGLIPASNCSSGSH